VSAGSLPYHLRTNKAVDRQIFLEMLGRLDRTLHFEQDYEYLGLGGPFMDDFRLLHEAFPTMPMTSVEREPEVLKRQRFNRPHSAIKFVYAELQDFIADYKPQKKVIAWLDYTSARELLNQTREIQDLLSKVPSGSVSVLKFTVNAYQNVAPAIPPEGNPPPSLQQRRLASLQQRFAHLPLDPLAEADMEGPLYAKTILRVLHLSILEKIGGLPGTTFEPLYVASYADGQKMLTLAGAFGETDAVNRALKSCRIQQWQFFSKSWSDIREIGVPELSSRERLFIRQMLPGLRANARQIRQKLRFNLAETSEESEKLLKQYIAFYRHLPFFERVSF
jgi:hypothetical protein